MRKKFSSFYFISKIFFLLIAFCVSIYAMYFLNTQGIQSTQLDTLFNPDKVAKENWNFCQKPLSSIRYQDKEKKSVWELTPENSYFKECFSQLCNMHIFITNEDHYIPFYESITYQFEDGSQSQLRLNSSLNKVFFEGKVYTAPKWLKTIKELPKLGCPSPGS